MMGAISDVITMLEAVRVEIAAEREAIDARVVEILAETKRQTSALYIDAKDLETRDRMLVSAISTLHDVAARGRKAGAGEGDPSPRPSPTRGEGEEAQAAAVSDCAIDAVAGAVAVEGAAERQVEDVNGRDEPSHGAQEIPAGSPVTDDDRIDAGPEGNHRPLSGAGPTPSAVASADGTVTAEEDPHPGPLPGGEGEGAAALTPDERTVRAYAVVVDRPMTKARAQAAIARDFLPSLAPARPVPAYEGVGVKAPARGAAVAGEVVQVPLVESVYVAEGQRLADQIMVDLPELMALCPQGPTVGQLAEYYQAPSSRVRDALNRLKEQRRAVVHKAKKTGFLHLMPLGSRP